MFEKVSQQVEDQSFDLTNLKGIQAPPGFPLPARGNRTAAGEDVLAHRKTYGGLLLVANQR